MSPFQMIVFTILWRKIPFFWADTYYMHQKNECQTKKRYTFCEKWLLFFAKAKSYNFVTFLKQVFFDIFCKSACAKRQFYPFYIRQTYVLILVFSKKHTILGVRKKLIHIIYMKDEKKALHNSTNVLIYKC